MLAAEAALEGHGIQDLAELIPENLEAEAGELRLGRGGLR